MESESVFDDEPVEMLRLIAQQDQYLKASQLRLSRPIIDPSQYFTEAEKHWFRIKAFIDILGRLTQCLQLIVDHENKHLAGKQVLLSVADIAPMLHVKECTVHRLMKRIKPAKDRPRTVWDWGAIRHIVIPDFTRWVMLDFLAAVS